MVTKMHEYDDEDFRVIFNDVHIELNGITYGCEGEAFYQNRLRYDEEDGKGWTFEDLEIDVLISYRWDDEAEWIESPEMDDNIELREKLLAYLEA